MFKAYKEPPKPSFDWKQWGIEKGIPLAGTVAGTAIGAYYGSPTIGAQIGGNLGGALSGALTEKPTGQAQMMKGFEGAAKGYDTWKEKVPSDELDINKEGKAPGVGAAQPAAVPAVQQIAPETMIGSDFGSSRAGSFFGKNALSGSGMQTGSFDTTVGQLTPQMQALLENDTTAGQLTPQMQALLAKGRRR